MDETEQAVLMLAEYARTVFIYLLFVKLGYT